MIQRSFKSNSGLSLLELLIALAIMAIIAGSLARSLSLGIRVWESSNVIQEQQEPLILRSLLRDWIAQTTPPNRILPFDTEFVGTINSFSFLTLAETPFEPDAAALRINIDALDQSLIMTLKYLDDNGAIIKEDSRQLAATNTKPILTYFSKNTDPAGWISNWTSEATLPDLIRIEIPDADLFWPEFTVAPILR